MWETVRLQTLGMFTRLHGLVKFGAALGKTVSQKAQAAHLQWLQCHGRLGLHHSMHTLDAPSAPKPEKQGGAGAADIRGRRRSADLIPWAEITASRAALELVRLDPRP